MVLKVGYNKYTAVKKRAGPTKRAAHKLSFFCALGYSFNLVCFSCYVLNVFQDIVKGFAPDVVEYSFPESSGTDCTRHGIGAVETEDRRRVQCIRHASGQIIRISVTADLLVHGQFTQFTDTD